MGGVAREGVGGVVRERESGRYVWSGRKEGLPFESVWLTNVPTLPRYLLTFDLVTTAAISLLSSSLRSGAIFTRRRGLLGSLSRSLVTCRTEGDSKRWLAYRPQELQQCSRTGQ